MNKTLEELNEVELKALRFIKQAAKITLGKELTEQEALDLFNLGRERAMDQAAQNKVEQP